MKTDMRSLLRKLLLRPAAFEAADAAEAMHAIMGGAATPAQIAAFLVGLKHAGETAPIVAACAEAMRSHALPLSLGRVVDVVGTGGDGVGTFNVSTAAGVVAAAAGAHVAKHGNRSSSSPTGSADFIEALGAKLDLDAEQLGNLIERTGYCFVYAQKFHPAMRHVAGPRREIGVPTIFNILGPLSSPARPRGLVVGVYDAALGPLVAETFRLQGVEHALVVHGMEGLDEVWHLKDGTISEKTVTPADFGIAAHSLNDVKGGSSAENADMMRRVLGGDHNSPIADFIVLNAAALLFVADLASSFSQAATLARDAITSGKALETLNTYIQLSNM